jgi:hypothetical protein
MELKLQGSCEFTFFIQFCNRNLATNFSTAVSNWKTHSKMKNSFIVCMVILSFSLSSCDETNGSITKNIYFENSQLNSALPLVRDGENLVFHHFYQADDEENIADDEYSENIYFELASGVTSFEIKDAGLEDLKFAYYPLCFCAPVDSTVLTGGTITGEKNGNNWKINVAVTLLPFYQYDADSSFAGDPIIKSFAGTFSASSN